MTKIYYITAHNLNSDEEVKVNNFSEFLSVGDDMFSVLLLDCLLYNVK